MTDVANPCLISKPIVKVGGLERYVAELAVILDAPIYTPIQTTDLPETTSGPSPEVIEFRQSGWFRSALDRLPMSTIFSTLEYENFAVPDKYDLVITGSETAKAVVHQPHQRRVHLLNMPPRWLFDRGPGRYDDLSPPAKWVKCWYQSQVRVHDVSTVSRIEEFIVPSETIGQRLETYYHRTAERVIYPPVDTGRYRFEANGGYLLYVGRLAPAKCIVELVEALSETDYRLKVAGTGPQEQAVRQVAGPNVEVLGYVSEDEKQDLLANCDGLVFNSDREAFGIVPVEALASGKPVIGIDEGFTRHQIRDGENGVLFSRGAENLQAGIARMYDQEWNPNQIQESAKRYDIEKFREAWQEFCNET